MTRLTRKAARSKGFDPVAAGYGGVRAPCGAVLSMALSLVIGLAWCGRAWGATDVEYHNPNTASTAYDDRNGSYYNTDAWHYDSEGDHQVPANAYKIQDGRLYRAVTNWTWMQNTINDDPNEGRWTAVISGAPVWTPVDWDKTINITSDLYDETFVSYGDATGDDTITPSYKGSGNTVNISGNGAISGSLSLYDPGNNADYNTLNIGYHSGTGYNGTHIDGFELANSASGSVSGTVDVGRGYVYLYSGTVTTAGEIYARNGNTTFTQMDGDDMGAQSNGGAMSGTVYMDNDFAASFNYSYLHSAGTQNGTVYMNGDNNANHYVFSGGTISGTGGIYMDGDGTTNRFSQTGGAASGETIHMDGHNSIWNIYQQTGGSNSNTVNIGDAATDLAGTTAHGGIFYVGGGTRSGTAAMIGDNNLFWLNNTANYAATASTTVSSGVNTGNNVGVVDLASGRTMAGTLNLSGTTSGQNNLFFANGDVTGTITTSGTAGDPNESQTHAFVGYVAGQGYSWYNNENYDLTGINLQTINNTPAAVSGMPTGTPAGSNSGYFAMNQINATAADNLNVKSIVGGGGEVHAHVSAGDAYNIRDGSAAGNTEITHTPGLDATYGEYPYMYPFGYPYSPDENSLWHDIRTIGFVPYVTGTGATLNDLTYLYEQTTDYFNNGGYLTYSVLNQDVVNVGAYVDVNPANGGAAGLFLSPTNVTIGAIKDMTGTAVDIAAGDFNNAYNPIDLSSGEWIPGEHDNHTVDYYLRDENGDGVYDNYEGRAGAHQYSKWFDSYIVDEGGPGEKLVEHQAQITAGMVNVYAGSKLTIHPNVKEMGLADEAFRTANADSINIIENLNIIGMPDEPADCNDCGYTPYNPAKWAVVTIDRTTVYANTDGTKITHGTPGDGTIYYPGENDAGFYYANVVVGTNGILQGFGEITSDDDHSPLRPNVVGDVAVLAGGMLRPYDAHYEGKQIFNYEDKTWETIGDGGIFVVHGNALNSNEPTHADYVENSGGDFDRNADRLKGVIMKIDGTVYMEHASRVATNLFADLDEGSDPLSIVSDGTDVRNDPVVVGRVPAGQALDVTRHKGDGIEATEKFVFDEIKYTSAYLKDGKYDQSIPGTTYYSLTDPRIWTGVAQHNKVQYVPTFGFVNELKAKLDYNIYWGDPVVQNGDATYYYQVTYNSGDSPEKIAALEGMPDANHLFNRDIVFSDMLGNWSFEKQADDRGVVLRYRQVAKHAQDGGIAIDQDIRNSQQVGYKLDEIRYPFLTAYNMNDKSLQGVFYKDPSLDGNVATPYETVAGTADYEYAQYDGNPYDVAGYDGDIKSFYYIVADPDRDYNYMGYSVGENPFTNYRDYWVEDIENYFRALQLNVTSQADIYLSLRLLSAEPYASQVSSDLSAMNRFIDNRERNGMSALWLVEEKRRMANEAMGVGTNGFDEDMPSAFVQNPLRVWATALGANYRQKDVGDEYGFKNSGYGLQLGFIKEIGDAYFGLTGAYTNTKNKWSDLQADNKSDNYMAEALIGLRRERFFLELSANAGYMDHSMTRDLTHGASLSGGAYDPQLDCNIDDNYYNGIYSVKHYADFHNRVLGGGLRLGYQKVLGEKWLFLPTIGVRFQDVRNSKSFTEKGKETASFRLVFDKGAMKRQSLQIPVMFRLSRGIAFNDGGPTILTPEIRVGATYEAMDRGGVADYQWIGNPIPNRTMRAWGIREDRLGLQAGATLELSRRGRFYAAMNYDVIYQDKGFSHNYSLQAGVNF